MTAADKLALALIVWTAFAAATAYILWEARRADRAWLSDGAIEEFVGCGRS